MNNDLMKVIVPAVVALAGTVFGLWLGQRRWASEFRMKKRLAFDASRYEAYSKLWEVLETSHIIIRKLGLEQADIHNLEQQINAFRLRNAILLDRSDIDLSERYFHSIVSLAQLVAEFGSEGLRREFNSTVLRPAEAKGPAPEIRRVGEANENMIHFRDTLIERIRSVMLETSYAASK